MSEERDDEDLRRLLAEAGFPWGRVWRTGGGRYASVEAVRALAQSRGMESWRIEAAMDRFAIRHHGRRVVPCDPWSLLPNLINRLRGRPVNRPEIWVMPLPGSTSGSPR